MQGGDDQALLLGGCQASALRLLGNQVRRPACRGRDAKHLPEVIVRGGADNSFRTPDACGEGIVHSGSADPAGGATCTSMRSSRIRGSSRSEDMPVSSSQGTRLAPDSRQAGNWATLNAEILWDELCIGFNPHAKGASSRRSLAKPAPRQAEESFPE